MAKKKNTETQKIQRVQLSDAANPDWKELFDKLWEQGTWGGRGYYAGRRKCICQPEKVRLSQVGWDQIKQIIVDEGICVSVVNSCMGFSCSLVLWTDREEPYPGAVVKPKWLFQVCSHMLPGDKRSVFKDGWAEFEPLFTSDENVARLKANRMELPKPAHHYDY